MANSKKKSQGKEMFAEYPDLLTTKQICEITGLSAQTIRAEAHAGRLPMVKIGKTWFCSKRRFIEYLETV